MKSLSVSNSPILMNRRSCIVGSVSALLALGAGRVLGSPRFSGYPFKLGVASGDPAADGFVLWTRLAPDPLHGGGMANDSVSE